MSLINSCPLPAALGSVPETSCPVIFGQISKIAIQRIQAVPSFTLLTAILKATWTPHLAAVDDEKIVLTPMISNLVLPASELLSEGGNDNTTVNGIRNVRGLGSLTVTGQILNISEATKAALQALFAESKSPTPGATNLWGYFLTTDGKVIGKKEGANLAGIPLYNLALTDPGSEGFNKDNVFNFSFDLEGGWSDGFEVLKTTDIKPLTFKNPA